MIDIHTHILPGVDDGCETEQEAIELIKQEVDDGVKDIILTPHYRANMQASLETLSDQYERLKQKCSELNIPVNLYLGQEIYVTSNLKENLKNGQNLTLNNSKYILIEFNMAGEAEVVENVYELVNIGLIPIVAHVERYSYINFDLLAEIKAIGGLIQVNASSISGETKRIHLKFIKKLFKLGLVDVVASDLHKNRKSNMASAYSYVRKKFGADVAERVFRLNMQEIIKG